MGLTFYKSVFFLVRRMGSRGRKSTQALAVATVTGPVEIVQRPDAPYDLTDEQVDEWRAVVNSLPADWFQRGKRLRRTVHRQRQQGRAD